ncbi:hypothetical protein C7476_105302 [Phyllobacterium bourgognense]|uniref:Uncharacterized protein n=1 Tax=Phyllobacterium bourgognense TaxID=314236 RepID=A0A368YX13_9HYPH|nr:hypothetical protein C7476_105302 [Phyllobacterium bourgognense]
MRETSRSLRMSSGLLPDPLLSRTASVIEFGNHSVKSSEKLSRPVSGSRCVTPPLPYFKVRATLLRMVHPIT